MSGSGLRHLAFGLDAVDPALDVRLLRIDRRDAVMKGIAASSKSGVAARFLVQARSELYGKTLPTLSRIGELSLELQGARCSTLCGDTPVER